MRASGRTRPPDDPIAVDAETSPTRLARRLLPVQIGAGLQGFMLWLPVEKLFMSQIGFTAASIGMLAAAYAAVIPLLEVPSGILADRWSRSALMALASVALAASTLVGGLSHSVATYVVAAMILGVFIALSSGTVDSIVYDTVLEETGSSNLYERWIGRIRIIESTALVASAVAGGLLAGWATPRLTYLLTVPVALASVAAFLAFREPRLHRQAEPTSLRIHVATTFRAMTRRAAVRRLMLLSAATGLLSQAIFEFGPLWLVSLAAPPWLYGPYWAALVATIGLGGYAVSKIDLGRRLIVLPLMPLLVVAAAALALGGDSLGVVIAAQVVLALGLGMLGIHAGKLLHDSVESAVRAGVSSGVGTLSWVLFLPFSLLTGWVAREQGVATSGWLFVSAAAVVAVLMGESVLHPVTQSPREPTSEAPDLEEVPTLALASPPLDLACQEMVYLVTDYFDGNLPEQWRTTLEAHLASCDGCTTYVQQLRRVIDELGSLSVDLPIAPSPPILSESSR